ncbi:YqzK family protein [Paucisalibacillus globulus]|uniref:YqzK family protein n=1 Tax=Paucisalibacillus globulus TaxID=351095 RepID=UPI0004284D1E|nr:YqzK family protein [Paucisalibacillus globulus]
MKRMVWDTVKVFVIFVTCTCLFYFGLQVMHSEYEQFHRYDSPNGPAVKVFNSEQSFIERLNIFFRLGE